MLTAISHGPGRLGHLTISLLPLRAHDSTHTAAPPHLAYSHSPALSVASPVPSLTSPLSRFASNGFPLAHLVLPPAPLSSPPSLVHPISPLFPVLSYRFLRSSLFVIVGHARAYTQTSLFLFLSLAVVVRCEAGDIPTRDALVARPLLREKDAMVEGGACRPAPASIVYLISRWVWLHSFAWGSPEKTNIGSEELGGVDAHSRRGRTKAPSTNVEYEQGAGESRFFVCGISALLA